MTKKKTVDNVKKFKQRSFLPWDKLRCIAVVGETGSGKTVTCFSILDQIKGKSKYIYNHPQPSILVEANVENLEELSLEQMSDCVLYIDEPQLHIGASKDVKNLLRLYSLARQRDINIIFSTSDTRFLTVGIEAYIDCWLIKDLNYRTIKRGSFIKDIINEFCFNIFPEGFKLKIDEAVVYCRRFLDKPTKRKIKPPKYWSEQFSKPYKNDLFHDEENLFPPAEEGRTVDDK